MINLYAFHFSLYSYPFMSYVVLVVTPVTDFLVSVIQALCCISQQKMASKNKENYRL